MAVVDAERNALLKGQTLAAQVGRVKYGVYTVPSQTEPGVYWTVIDTGHGLQCTCTAGMLNRPCAHKGAVLVRRQQEAEKRATAPRPTSVKRVALV